VSKPTLNLFLFDLRENLRLRGAEQYTTINLPNGTSQVKRNPIRMDLRYLMTAWVKEAEDEHLLLSTALMGLLRNPFIPKDLCKGRLEDLPAPIPIEVATFIPEMGPIDKFSEIWGVLDNEMRLSVLITVTVPVDPYKPELFKQVFTREMRFIQDTGIGVEDAPDSTRNLSKSYVSIAGTIKSKKYAPSSLTIVLVEKQEDIKISDEGGYTLQKIEDGEYHLDILFNEKVLKRQKIVVPSENYDIQL